MRKKDFDFNKPRFYKYKRPNVDFPLENSGNDNKSSRLVELSSFVANLSQLAMLFVVVWGYVYTVLPVFQKEQIAEELAKLELDKNEWQEKRDEFQREVKLLNDEKNRLLDNIDSIVDKNRGVEKKLLSTSYKLRELNEQYKKVNSNLTVAENELYEMQRNAFLGNNVIPKSTIRFINNSSYEYEVFNKNNADKIASLLEGHFIQPVEFANENLKEIMGSRELNSSRVNGKIFRRFVDEYRNGISKNYPLLQCATPDYSSWQSSFKSAFDYDSSIVDKCVSMHLKRNSYSSEYSEAVTTEFDGFDFMAQQKLEYKEGCEFFFNATVEKFFRKKWSYVIEPCNNKLMKVNDIVLNGPNSNNLVPERGLNPPTKSEVNEALIGLINNWYSTN